MGQDQGWDGHERREPCSIHGNTVERMEEQHTEVLKAIAETNREVARTSATLRTALWFFALGYAATIGASVTISVTAYALLSGRLSIIEEKVSKVTADTQEQKAKTDLHTKRLDVIEGIPGNRP